MVMEFLEGGSLSQAVSKFHLEEAQICYVTREVNFFVFLFKMKVVHFLFYIYIRF